MLSFDVVSLFTRVPIQSAFKNIAKQRLQSDPELSQGKYLSTTNIIN